MNKKPSKLSLLEKGFKISLRNIWRNKVISTATILVIAILIFIFNIILAINFIAKDALTDLSKRVDLIVYLKESTTIEETQELIDALKTQAGVEEIKYTSKENALTELKTSHPRLVITFEKYDLENPLPASLNITTNHPKYHPQIAEFLEQERYQKFLSNISSDEDEIQESTIIKSVSKNLLAVTNFANQIIFWLVITFLVGGALIILNALQITIFSRKKEIEVMKLVGASYWFIKLPFVIESIIYGILALSISFLMISFLAINVQIQNTNIWSYYTEFNFYLIFIIELIFTIMLSIVSSLFAVHEHIRTKQ